MSSKCCSVLKSASLLRTTSSIRTRICHRQSKFVKPFGNRTMATASHIELSLASAGVYHVPGLTSESAKLGSDLLQQNHNKNHMFFNEDGFHNHIAHHLLTLYALGASPKHIQRAYDHNSGYQRAQYPVSTRNVHDMADREKFKKFLGQEKYFHDYEVYFRGEIEAKGWQAVLNEHLFAGDDHAERLLVRMYAGFYHPIIHLGFGVEFEQPAIIVEALAQAAVHSGWVDDFLLGAEKLTKDATTPSKSMVQLLAECRANDTIKSSPHYNDANKIRDGIFVRAKEEMTTLASQWHVSPPDLRKKTAEMINNVAFFAGAAQMPPKAVKIDFFYMHCVNCSIFFDAFLRQDWLDDAHKCRLLEWKGRMDLALYVSRGSPELREEEIKDYVPKRERAGWSEIIGRVNAMEDDGHASKLVRALAHGEAFCQEFETQKELQEEFPVQGDMWLKLANMAIDSVEGEPPEGKWIRNCGFPKAWEGVPERSRL